MVFFNQKQQTTTDASIGKPLLGMSKNEKNQELRYHEKNIFYAEFTIKINELLKKRKLLNF